VEVEAPVVQDVTDQITGLGFQIGESTIKKRGVHKSRTDLWFMRATRILADDLTAEAPKLPIPNSRKL
jgi:hypothetical protein